MLDSFFKCRHPITNIFHVGANLTQISLEVLAIILQFGYLDKSNVALPCRRRARGELLWRVVSTFGYRRAWRFNHAAPPLLFSHSQMFVGAKP